MGDGHTKQHHHTKISPIDCEDNNLKHKPGTSLNYESIVNSVVLFKPTIGRDTQINRPHPSAKTHSESLTHDWEDEVHLSDEYASYWEAISTMLSEFHSMWHGNLGQITVTKHTIELTPENTEPIHSATYGAESKARKLERIESVMMLPQ